MFKEQVFPINPILNLETQQGDLESFNQLVLAYQDSLFNVAVRILGDAELAADATQEAFISAFRSMRSYRGGSLKAWLMRIVTNACYDELRRQKRHPTLPLEPNNADDEEIETPYWLADSRRLPEAVFEAAELERTIQRCLDALPIAFRTVVVLVDVMGMGYSEVAGIVCVPLGTVKSRLARARLRLRRSLLGHVDLKGKCAGQQPGMRTALRENLERSVAQRNVQVQQPGSMSPTAGVL